MDFIIDKEKIFIDVDTIAEEMKRRVTFSDMILEYTSRNESEFCNWFFREIQIAVNSIRANNF